MNSAKSFFAPHARGLSPLAGLGWLADVVGAALFAGCLSLYIAALAGAEGVIGPFWLLGGLVLGGLLRAAAQGVAAVAGQGNANRVKARLRAAVYARLLPTAQRRGALAGEDLRVAVDNIEACEGYFARFLPLRRASALAPLLVALLVAPASWVSTAIMLATLVPFIAGMVLAGYAARDEADRQFEALSRLSGLFVDRVRHLPIILAYGVQDRIARQLGTAAGEVADRTMRVLRVAFLSSAVLEFFAALSVALVAVYCGFSLLGLLPFEAPEQLTLARAFFALAMAPEFYLALRRLAAAYHDKQQGEAAAASLSAACERGAAALLDPAPAPAAIARLGLQRFEVAYPGGWRIGPLDAVWQEPGLHAITGETGSGKSSLLGALVGAAPAAGGAVLIDDVPASPGALAAAAGWAGQAPLLLPGTLLSNLLLGNTQAGGEQITQMLALLGLDTLAERRGEDLPIDPRGSGLSGGERRRIGIARAALSGRPLLLLDEPTADLDDALRDKVIAALEYFARDRLVIVATHDAQLVARAQSELRL